MEESSSKQVTKIICTANSHFKVLMHNAETIHYCLKNPKHRMAPLVRHELKTLLIAMKRQRGHAPGYHREFWRKLQRTVYDAIDHLSGKRTKILTQKFAVSHSKCSNHEGIRKVLQIVELQCVVPFWFAAPELFNETAVKVAEGSFGEIYKITKASGHQRVLKIIPVEGSDPLTNQPHFTYQEVSAEIYTSVELGKLSRGSANRCSTFPNIYRVCLVQGTLPSSAVHAWTRYSREHSSSHPRPDQYDPDQAFIVIETDVGGIEVDYYRFKSYLKVESMFKQVSCAVAVAEKVCRFEHRDLHIGNILVQDCNEKVLEVKYRNKKYKIETHGVKAMIIDFTFSRIQTGDDVKYLNLDDFYNIMHNCRTKFRDHRYVYWRMERVTQRYWREFYPKTNLLWMKHITESLLYQLERRKSKMSANENLAKMALRMYNRSCLSYESVSEFVKDLVLQ